jgi:hypothetical protein
LHVGRRIDCCSYTALDGLPPPRGMAIGAIDSSNVFVAQGDTGNVNIQRLTEITFWGRSLGRASIGNAPLAAQRNGTGRSSTEG